MRGVVKCIASVLISVLISAIVIVGLAFQVEPFVSLEKAGADLTNRLYVELIADDSETLDRNRDRYAFVDIDYDACAAFTSTLRCRSGLPIPEQIVFPLVKAIVDAGASIVIVDIQLSPDQNAADQTVAALSELNGASIIVPIATRPIGERGLVTERIPVLQRRSVHFAAFATVIDDANDGRIRTYPQNVRVEDVSGNVKQVPTAPALAASLITGRHLETGGHHPLSIFYSFPPMTGNTYAQAFDHAYRFERIFKHIKASQLIREGRIRFPAGRPLEGRTVIVSTSAAQGHDYHLTPVGVMSGAEVIINATRAFAYFPKVIRSYSSMGPMDLVFAWKKKLDAVYLPAILLVPFFLLREWFLRRAESERNPWMAAPITLLGWFGILAATLTIEISGSVSEAIAGARSGFAVDLITPVLLIGLDVYREFIGWIVRSIESLLYRAIYMFELIFYNIRQYF